MRTFNVGFLAVLSCIAMIGATPIENPTPDKDLDIPTCSGGSETAVIDISLIIKYIAFQQLRRFRPDLNPFSSVISKDDENMKGVCVVANTDT